MVFHAVTRNQFGLGFVVSFDRWFIGFTIGPFVISFHYE